MLVLPTGLAASSPPLPRTLGVPGIRQSFLCDPTFHLSMQVLA